jgi:hypothetical protein
MKILCNFPLRTKYKNLQKNSEKALHMVKLCSDSLRRDIFQLLKGQGHDGLTKQVSTFLVKKVFFGSSLKRKKLNVKIQIASLKALTNSPSGNPS